MSFKPVNFASVARFNSAASSEVLSFYEDFLTQKLSDAREKPSRTFAPSCFRCDRKNWFRLRGAEPEAIKNPDATLNFKAEVGTARHLVIQNNLKDALGADWVDAEDYLKENPIPYEYSLEKKGLETRITINKPPIRFACDGIIRWKGEYYLLEIKTADYSAWDSLTDPKDVHVDQIKCYSTLLGLPKVLVIYEDRFYGGLKCYSMEVSLPESQAVLDKFERIQQMAVANLAPDRLPKSDYQCKNCEYSKKCNQWG